MKTSHIESWLVLPYNHSMARLCDRQDVLRTNNNLLKAFLPALKLPATISGDPLSNIAYQSISQ